jgi:hypothetical protein
MQHHAVGDGYRDRTIASARSCLEEVCDELTLSLPVWVVVVAVGVAAAIGAATFWDVSRLYREPVMRWQERRWRRLGKMPQTVQRTYRTLSEYQRDAVRLRALGYAIVDEAPNPLRGDEDWVTGSEKWTGASLSTKAQPRPVARGIPAMFVTYSRAEPR